MNYFPKFFLIFGEWYVQMSCRSVIPEAVCLFCFLPPTPPTRPRSPPADVLENKENLGKKSFSFEWFCLGKCREI